MIASVYAGLHMRMPRLVSGIRAVMRRGKRKYCLSAQAWIHHEKQMGENRDAIASYYENVVGAIPLN